MDSLSTGPIQVLLTSALLGSTTFTGTGRTVATSLAARVANDVFNLKSETAVVGDDSTNDTVEFQKALTLIANRGGGTLFVPKGTYRVKALSVSANTRIVGEPGAIISASDRSDTTGSNTLMYVRGNDVAIEDVLLQGTEYVSTSDTVYPTNLLVVAASPAAQLSRVTLRRVRARGGRYGLTFSNVKEVVLDHCNVQHCGQRNVIFNTPANSRIFINQLDSHDAGLEEGLVIGSLTTEAGYGEEIIITGLRISGCGSGSGQEGLDIYINALRRFILTDFAIKNCGNGGIELKTAENSDGTYYEDILIANGLIECTADSQGGILLNRPSGFTMPDSTRARRVHIVNVDQHYSGTANPTSAFAYGIAGWNRVSITGGRVTGDFTAAFRLQPNNTTDKTLQDLVIGGGFTVRDAQYGVLADQANTIVDKLHMGEVDIETTGPAVFFNTATGSLTNSTFKGGRYEQTDDSETHKAAIKFSGTTLTNVELEDVKAKGTNYGLYGTSTQAGTGNKIRGGTYDATHASGVNSIRIDGSATVEIVRPNVPTLDANKGVVGTATLTIYDALRGAKASAPTTAGSVGEVWGNSAPSAGGAKEWVCTTAGGNGAATWKALNIAA